MPRSYDERRFPRGPRNEPGGFYPLRGPKRIGPIGAVVPGDDVEVARELARLRMLLRTPQVRGGTGSDCCPEPGSGSGGRRWVEGGFYDAWFGFSSLIGWWRLGDGGTTDGDDFANSAVGHSAYPAEMARNDGSIVGYTGMTLGEDGPPAIGEGDDGCIAQSYSGGTAHPFLTSGGVDRLVVSSTATDYLSPAALTLACWVKWGPLVDPSHPNWSASLSPQAKGVICGNIGVNGGGANEGWALMSYPAFGTFGFESWDGSGGFQQVVGPPLTEDFWYFLALTFDGTDYKLYLNNVLVEDVASTEDPDGHSSFVIGSGQQVCGGGDYSAAFTGSIDEVALFDEALSSAEILSLYYASGAAGSGGHWEEWTLSGGEIEDGAIRDSHIVSLSAYKVKDSVQSLTAADTVDPDVSLVLADASGGAFTVTLPPPTLSTGRRITVKRVNSGANAVTVADSGTELIDGAGTYSLSAQYKYVTVACDGSTWHVVANN